MRKLLSFCVMCLAALTMSAQRCAVMEFKAGAGISQADVDGISGIFTTYFHPVGYTMVERTQINNAIKEQGFQRSNMTEDQTVRIGKILNVAEIVIGDVNIVMGQYNVDVRVINVESGTISATEGEMFTATTFRTTMQGIAEKLANKLVKNGVRALGNFIDLGLPSGTLWKAKNEKGFYDYDSALKKFGNSIPTKEQWEELLDVCEWEKLNNREGYKVTGPSGQSINLTYEGTPGSDYKDYGWYLSSTTHFSQGGVWFLLLSTASKLNGMNGGEQRVGYSVRLVK